MTARVIIKSLDYQSGSLLTSFEEALLSLNMHDNFNNAKAVFIKPNLTHPHYRPGVTTRRDFVASLVQALRKINGTTRIYIGEGEGGYNSFSMIDGMRSMGYYELENQYPNMKVVNLSKLPRIKVELQVNNAPYYLDLPALFFEEIDFSITCPLPKVHCMTGITLSIKNQWGCLPDTMRLKNHYVFNEIIVQVCEKLKFRYAFLDGKYGLDINGPITGNPVEVNWFAASDSLGAFDMVVSGMMGFDWKKIGHLRSAQKYGYLPEQEEMEILGNPKALRRQFRLRRSAWNYPALAAFHSKLLTHLFYFSHWARLLHKIMYLFRKKPIE